MKKFSKVDKLDSNFIKLQLMRYWRYDRGFTFVCSECINHSDINALNSNILTEVEIKISKEDFLNEFNGKSKIKSYKHNIMNNLDKKKPKKNYIVPNFYYFCVTNELKNFVLEYLDQNYPNYGLLICDNYRQYGRKSHIYCIKKAKKLHNKPPNEKVFTTIGKRVQSELIGLKEKVLNSNLK